MKDFDTSEKVINNIFTSNIIYSINPSDTYSIVGGGGKGSIKSPLLHEGCGFAFQ